MRVELLILTLFIWLQQSDKVEFLCYGKFYEFRLPENDYTISTAKYTEGTFTTYQFKSGEIIVLHVGSAVLKPFLTEKWHKVTVTSRTEFGKTRKGYDKRTKLFWQENTSSDEFITLYFANVSEDKRTQFEESVESLRLVRTIR
jgi:hypothetical protein